MSNYFYSPYITVSMEEYESNREKYRDFMENYCKQHKACPNCGETKCSSTYIGYVVNSEKPEEYKDKNICECKCGSKHTTHDRVPERDFDGNSKDS